MATNSIATQGCSLYVLDDVTVPAVPAIVRLASVKGLQSLGGTATDIDISNLDSTLKEFAKGLLDPGSPSFDLVFDPTNAGHKLLQTLSTLGTNATKQWYFGLSNYSGAAPGPAPTASPLPPVANTPTTSTTGGTGLAATTPYFYVITAKSSAGETLKSNEVTITTGAGSTNSNTITWAAVTGATGYNIYRGTATGVENVYYTVGAVTTFTDTGAAATSGTPPTTGVTAIIPATGRTGLGFAGYVKQYQYDAQVNGIVIAKVQLKATGAITLTP